MIITDANQLGSESDEQHEKFLQDSKFLHQIEVNEEQKTDQNLEEEMKRSLLQLYDQNQQMVTSDQPTAFVSLVQMARKHPIFNKLSEKALTLIFQFSYLTFLKKNQILYKEEEEQPIVYIPIYGMLSIWSRKKGTLGKVIIGWTLGEECLCDVNFVCRIENCYAETESALLAIEVEKFQKIKKKARKSNLMKDINMLEVIFRRNFFIKKHWRTPGGISKVTFKKQTLHSSFIDL